MRLSEALAKAKAVEQAKAPRKAHPDGWEPAVQWDERTRSGSLTIAVNKPGPEWNSYLKEWGFDPEQFEIADGTVQFRTWDAAIGDGNTQRFYYYRATIRAKRQTDDPDIKKLLAEIKSRKAKKITATGGDRSLVIALADWQIGMDGTADATDRILKLIDAIPERWKELERTGVKLSDITLLGLGDLVEGCSGDWYPAQTFQAELNNREQRTLARRLLVKIIEAAAATAPRVRVAVIGGNHGEARRDGKAYTDTSDNADVEVAEQTAEIMASSEAYKERVAFTIPRDELAITLDLHGTIIGITHGHLAKRGVNASAKVEQWWKGQALGMRPIADATLLITGHYHHLSITQHGPRTHIQAPAMCGASAWYGDLTGTGDSGAGTLSFTVGADGWDHLKILARERMR
jgi:predicted phosphodiesterase